MTKMLPGGAADFSRAAVLTLSPEGGVLALLDPRVERDQRLAGRDADVDLQVSVGGELLTDRRRGPGGTLGSSSCETGAPKIAITASPTNFATVPPCRSRTERRWAW